MTRPTSGCAICLLLATVAALLCGHRSVAQPLAGTTALGERGDLAAEMVAGIDRFLMRAAEASAAEREKHWKRDYSSHEAYEKSVAPNRERFRKIIGVVDARAPFDGFTFVATTKQPSLIAATDAYEVHTIRWPVFIGVHGEGLLLEPKSPALGNVIALPDADWSPEMAAGLAPGLPPEAHFARRLAEAGYRVLVPTLIDRADDWSGHPRIRYTNQPHREFIYRMAYEMGSHVIGYEVQKVLAVVDEFERQWPDLPVGVAGYGEGRVAGFL